jgi:hypothetical protein
MIEGLPVPRRWKLAAPEFGEQKDRRRQARNGTVCGVLIWNYEEAEGEVLLHPNFFYGDALAAADAIKDWRGLLEREYDEGFPILGQRRKNKTEGKEGDHG